MAWHEQAYQRVKMMKSTYSPKLNEIYQHVCNKLASIQPNPTSTQPQPTVAAKFEHYNRAKRTLEGIFVRLNATKREMTPDFKEKLDHLEEQIKGFVQIYSLRQQGQQSANVQPGVQLVPSQSRISQGESSERKPNSQVKNLHISPFIMPSPQQNMIHLQGQSSKQVSEKGKSAALMQQVTTESRKKAGDSKNPSENLSFSSCGGNSVQQQRSDALKSTVPCPSKTHGISPPKLLRDFSNTKTVPKDSTFSSDGFPPAMQQLVRAHHALTEEIREINNRLIDVELVMSEKDIIKAAATGADDGFHVKCFFRGIAVDWNSMPPLKINPLRLLIPTNYPACSPIFVDEMPVQIRPLAWEKEVGLGNTKAGALVPPPALSKTTEDLTAKARYKLSISLWNQKLPCSLRDIAMLWQDCTREAIIDFAKPYGGGTFSSKYGEWEEVVCD
ncbi:hypothetical protein L6164_017780 [Bauhinia variegata]|nr:hypothetical protein L6164_017780 [Bauhinia variegata]